MNPPSLFLLRLYPRRQLLPENVFTAVQRFNVEDGVGNLFMNNTVFTACLEAGTGAALGNIPRCDGEADSGEEDDDLGGSEE